MTQSTRARPIVRDSLIVGFAMFAVFFGAGNLIFPPRIGFLAGTGWGDALIGLLLTGMLLPVLTIVALGLRGGSVARLTAPIGSWFGSALLAVSLVVLAWMIAIPRTASVAYETGFLSLAPGLNRDLWLWIFIPLFFVASTALTLDRSGVIDRIGRYLTPLLLGLLGVIVLWAVWAPLGAPVDTGEAAPFRLGLITGYQTGDVFGGFMFGIIFIDSIRDRGYAEGQGFRTVLGGAAVVTFLGLLFVYGGLEYLGATGSGVLTQDVAHASLLTALVNALAGRIGATALAVAVVLACLTTAVGATAVLGRAVEGWTGGRVRYRTAVLIVSLTTMVQAFGGVDQVVALADPLFRLFYPVGISIVVLALLPQTLLNNGVWRGAALAAGVMGVIDVALALLPQLGVALPAYVPDLYAAIPLQAAGFGWLLPTVAGGLLGGIACRLGQGTTGVQAVAE